MSTARKISDDRAGDSSLSAHDAAVAAVLLVADRRAGQVRREGDSVPQRWFLVLMSVASVVALESGLAQVRATDAERLLADRFRFTAAEIAQARSGKAIAKLLPSRIRPRSAWSPQSASARARIDSSCG